MYEMSTPKLLARFKALCAYKTGLPLTINIAFGCRNTRLPLWPYGLCSKSQQDRLIGDDQGSLHAWRGITSHPKGSSPYLRPTKKIYWIESQTQCWENICLGARRPAFFRALSNQAKRGCNRMQEEPGFSKSQEDCKQDIRAMRRQHLQEAM